MKDKEQWLSIINHSKNGNSSRTLCRWAYAMVEASSLNWKEKFESITEAMEVIYNKGLRGDISDKWKKMGFTNEQFNYQLFV